MNMEMPWHEECLKNMKITLEGTRQEIARLRKYENKLESKYNFLRSQIETAKAKGKDGFDQGKFMRPYTG